MSPDPMGEKHRMRYRSYPGTMAVSGVVPQTTGDVELLRGLGVRLPGSTSYEITACLPPRRARLEEPCHRVRLALVATLIVIFGNGLVLPGGSAATQPQEDVVPRPGSAVPGPPPPHSSEQLKQWRMAVVQHDPQRWDAAAALVGSWPAAVVTSVVNEVAAEASYRRGDSIRILKRGALLHTDIALMGRYMGTTTPAGGSGVTVALVNDGRFAGYDFGLHWALARRLLDSVPRRDPMVHQWYVATTACMESQLQWGQATYQFQRARIIFPSDPAIFFYMGAMHEVFASPAIQSARGGAVGSVGTELGLARQFYQRVLKLNPDFSEGRLHLGRVTGLLGRHDEAIVELEGAAAVLKDPQLLYYAALFLGREQENLAQADAARKQFERAAQLYPAAQSPLFALSFLARSRGDSTGALNTVERALTLKVNDPLGEDPWWTYNVAHVRNADALMADMRKAFGGLPR